MQKFWDKNLIVMLFLGVASGLPLALILSTLKALLSDKGFDLATIGFLSLVTLPYSLKIFFAPIIDSFGLPILTKYFGQRRSWIIFSQLLLMIFIAGLGLSTILLNLTAIAILSLLVAFASASQDIVIDAYRIELIKKENQGFAAGFYVYGYRIGMLISGAGALVLADIIGWDVVYFFMALLMVFGLITILLAEESRKDWQSKDYHFEEWFKTAVLEPFLNFTHHQKWFYIIIFVICFKLGDAFAGNLTLPFLLEMQFSKIQIAGIVKSFGLFATLFGVFIGGVLVKKIGMIKSLWIGAIAQMISNFSFSYLALIGNNSQVLYFVVFAENFSGGIGDAVFVVYLSSLCAIQFSATQYALLTSLATIARSTISSSAGLFAEMLGWYQFFIFSAILALPGIILLFLLTSKADRMAN